MASSSRVPRWGRRKILGGVSTETTWGGAGSDVAEAVETSADGSSYVAGITDSFAVDQFGTPSPRIFVVKFAANGSLTWQRIWNGTTVRGLGRPDVAVGSDGSVYVTGVTVANGNDAVLLKFDASGTLQWERTWGGAASDESFAVATAADGSAYIAGTATSFGPSSAGLFVVKFDLRRWQESGIRIRVADVASGRVAEDVSVPKPSHFKLAWYAAIALLGLRRNNVGGFGSMIPEATSRSGSYG
jgi:hypothetical protein